MLKYHVYPGDAHKSIWWQPIICIDTANSDNRIRCDANLLLVATLSSLYLNIMRSQQTMSAGFLVRAQDLVHGHLLEPALAVLALVSNPSSVTDTGSVYTFSREAILVARFGRRGVSEEHKVKQNIDHQVSVDRPQVAVGGCSGSKKKEFRFTFPSWIHFFCFFCQPHLLPTSTPTPRSTEPSGRPGPWRSAPGGSPGYSGCHTYNKEVLHLRSLSCIFNPSPSWGGKKIKNKKS